MSRMRSEPLTYETVLKMLKSSDPGQVAEGERIFKHLGPPAAELLLKHATNTRLKLENRLRFLRLAQSIGVTYDQDNCVRLQDLIEGRSQQIAELAKAILFEISPHGDAALYALPYMTFRLSKVNLGEAKKQLRKKFGA